VPSPRGKVNFRPLKMENGAVTSRAVFVCQGTEPNLLAGILIPVLGELSSVADGALVFIARC
jgi:hypothetical protein